MSVTREALRKHLKVISWYANNLDAKGVARVFNNGRYTIDTSPSWDINETYIIYDEFLNIRIAMYLGKQIQYNNSNKWIDISNCDDYNRSFNDPCVNNYRVKPSIDLKIGDYFTHKKYKNIMKVMDIIESKSTVVTIINSESVVHFDVSEIKKYNFKINKYYAMYNNQNNIAIEKLKTIDSSGDVIQYISNTNKQYTNILEINLSSIIDNLKNAFENDARYMIDSCNEVNGTGIFLDNAFYLMDNILKER